MHQLATCPRWGPALSPCCQESPPYSECILRWSPETPSKAPALSPIPISQLMNQLRAGNEEQVWNIGSTKQGRGDCILCRAHPKSSGA